MSIDERKGNKMKKLISIFLCLVLLIGVTFFTTSMVSAASVDVLTYTVTNGKVTITDCSESASGCLVIPDTIGGYSVTSIGESAFSNCSSLTSVTIPEGVTSIGYYAFSNCSGLISITIPDSVTRIGQDAFSGCENLNAVYITDLAAWCKILFIPCADVSFFGNSNPLYHGGDLYCNDELVTDLQIPKGITNIGNDAFYGCGSLTSVTIPDSVTSIGYRAFSYCSGLTSVTIPDSVTSIGTGAFSYCSGLTSVTIPDSMTSIGSQVFSYCSGLTSVTIPDSVTSIGSQAFYGCNNLNAVYITDLAAWCEIDSHGELLSYAKNLYLNGTLLSGDIVIPEGVTSIGNGAFSNCSGLTSVTIPDGVTSIGSQAFSNCSGLTSVTIPDSVTSIDTYAFDWCDNLDAVYITDLAAWCQIEFKTNSYDRYERSNPLRYAKKLYCNDILVTELEIPDGVTSIGDYAFYCFSGLTSVTIPDGVTSIGDEVFYGCSNLTYVTLPESVTSIGAYAFENSSVIDIACFENSYAHTYAINQGFSYLFLPSTPGAPTIESAGGSSVTLAATEGYQYSIDKKVWQDSPRFDNLSPLTTYIFYQRIKAKDAYASSYASPGMVMTKPIAAAPPAPIIDNVTADSITLKAVTGYQYSKDGIEWQESPLFEGLLPNTLYTFYQRVAESENAYFSVASAASTVLTKKNTYTDVVLNPDLSCVMATSIKLIAIEGYEYSLDGVTWQQSPLFSDLKPETVYTLYQRVVETDTTYASDASSVLIVTTLKGYMISYDAGDGKKAPTQQIKTEGIPLALSLQKPTRNGYSFIGWATSPTANVAYVAGAEFAIDENTTLYAKWLKICTVCDGDGRIINSRTCGSCGGSGNGMASCDSCSGSGEKTKSCPVGCNNGTIIINSTTVTTVIPCSTCKRSGSISVPCSSCSGSGSVRDTSGVISCDRCGGSGENYFFSTCSTCAGKGRVKESVDAIPGTPIFLQITATSVQLQEVDFCEYSCNGKDWQDSPLFDALQPNVTYTFYQRFKETETHKASQSSSATATTALEHSYSNACDTSCNNCGAVRVVGEHTYSGDADTSCNSCGAFAYPGGNVLYQEGGKYYHVINREKVNDTLLFKHTDSVWYYVNNGVVDFTKTGLVLFNNGKYFYVESGKINFSKTGLVRHSDGTWYYIKNGTETNDTLLVKYLDGNWYYVENGKINFSKTGLVMFNNGKYFYVQSGKINFSKTGLVRHSDGTWYYIKNGTETNETLLVKYLDGNWYYVENGKINFGKTGLVMFNNGKYFYVQSGKINFSKTGLVRHSNGTWYYIKNGTETNDTLLVKYLDGNWYYVENGKINFSKTGLVMFNNGKYFYVQNGKINFSKTGLVRHSDGTWYYIKNGTETNDTLLVKYLDGRYYYVQNGKINFAKTGSVYVSGKYYTVKNGVVV